MIFFRNNIFLEKLVDFFYKKKVENDVLLGFFLIFNEKK